jgi:hypothetical protein
MFSLDAPTLEDENAYDPLILDESEDVALLDDPNLYVTDFDEGNAYDPLTFEEVAESEVAESEVVDDPNFYVTDFVDDPNLYVTDFVDDPNLYFAPGYAEEAAPEIAPTRDKAGRALDPVKPMGSSWWSGQRKYDYKSLPDDFEGEERNSDFMRTPGLFKQRRLDHYSGLVAPERHVVGTHTHYMDEREQQAHRLRFQDGRAHHGDKRVSTQGASGEGSWGQKGANRHIYAMRPDGALHTAAAWDEHREVDAQEFHDANPMHVASPSARDDSTAVNLGFLNHSSLVAGGDVAGAGEMMIDDGEVRLVNDRSGHYKPDNEMLMNTVAELGEQGADLDKLTVEFANKKGLKQGIKHGDLPVRAVEAMAERDHGNGLEAHLRAKREARAPMFEELRANTPKIDAFAGTFADKRQRFERSTHRKKAPAATKDAVPVKRGNTASLAAMFEPKAPVIEEPAPEATLHGQETAGARDEENLYDNLYLSLYDVDEDTNDRGRT